MQFKKIGVLLFIFTIMIIATPQLSTGTMLHEELETSGQSLDQLPTQPAEETFLNASVTEVRRNITVELSAEVELEDEITLKIHGDDTRISYVNYSIPTVFADYVQKIEIFSQYDKKVGLENDNNTKEYGVYRGTNVTTYSIDVRQDGIPANNSLTAVYMKTRFTAIDLLSVSANGTGQRVEFYIPVVPMFSNLEVENSNIALAVEGKSITFQTEEMETFENVDGTPMPQASGLTLSYINMTRVPYSENQGMIEGDVAKIVYVSSTPIAETTTSHQTPVPYALGKARRTLRIDPWGKIFVREQIEVVHLGAPANLTEDNIVNTHQLTFYKYTLSSKALITDVYDNLGSLEKGQNKRDDNGNLITSISDINGKQELLINFRDSIYGGQSYKFTVTYVYNASQILEIERTNNRRLFHLNTELFSDFNTSIHDLKVVYELPPGATFQSHSYQSQSSQIFYSMETRTDRNRLSAFKHIELVFSGENVKFSDNDAFVITYTYNGLGHFQYFATFLGFALFVFSFFLAISNINLRPSSAREIEQELIPITEIDRFFTIFDDREAAENRLTELRQKRRKNKISKKDYEEKVKTIRKRIRELNPQLEEAAEKLSAKGGRYENLVTKLMLASQKKTMLRRNMKTLKRDYETGNVTKMVYRRSLHDSTQEFNKQNEIINKILAELSEIIQKYNL